MQKPNFLFNPLLAATPNGGASFPKITKNTIIQDCEIQLSYDADVIFTIVQACDVSGPVKIETPIIQACDVSGPVKIETPIIQACEIQLSYDHNKSNSISESLLVTITP